MLSLLGAGALLPVMQGQVIWDGGAGTGNWVDANNWNPNGLPASGANIAFDGAIQTTVNLGANRTVGTLTFNAGASAFTLNNNTITLGGTLTNSSAATQTINSAVLLNNNRTISATSGNLVFNGGFGLSNSTTARTLTVTGTFDTTISGVVGPGSAATGALTKTGTGTLTLTGANTYGGTTTLSAGTLAVASASSIGAGALSLGTGTFRSTGANLTFANALTLAGNTIFDGPGSLAFTNTALLGGSRTLTTNTQVTLGPVNMSGNTARTLTKAGAGTLVLSSAPAAWVNNSNLVVNNGVVRLGANNALGSGATLTNVTVNANVAGATALLDLNGFNQSILALTFGGTGGTTTSASNLSTGAGTLTLGGTLTYNSTGNPLGSTLSGNLGLGSANRTFAINDSTNAAADLTVSAAISGAAGVGITKTGAGTLVLSGANTYTGATSVSAGVVSVNTLADLGASSALGAPTTAAAGTIAIGSGTAAGTLRYTGSGSTSNRVVNLAGTTGGATLDASGSGALVLTSALTATGAGAKTLTLRGSSTAANTLAGAIVNNSGANLTSLLKTDIGTWVISGANTYTGPTTVNNGVLRLGSSASLANSALTVNANSAGATALLDLNGFNATVSSLTFGGTGGTTTSASNLSTGAGTLTLGGTLTYNATGNPLGSTLSGNLNLGAATRTFAVNDSASADADLAVSASISGSAGVGLTKTGAGTLVLSGASTYTGPTSVSVGTLRSAAPGALSASSAFTVSTGATLDLAGVDQTVASLAGAGSVALGSGTLSAGANNTSTAFSGVVSGTGGLTKQGAGTLTLSGANTFTGTATVSAGVLSLTGGADRLSPSVTLAIASGASVNLNNNAQTVAALSGAGSLVQGSGALTIDGASSTTFSGVISGTGALAKDGSGTLTLSGANTASGALSVAGGSLVLSGAAGALASVPSATVSAGASLVLDNTAASLPGRLSSALPVTLGGGSLSLVSHSGGTAQNLGVLNLAAGESSILVQQTGAGAAVLSFSSLGALDETATVNFGATGGTLGASASGPQIYIGGLSTGFIGGWATVGSDFAEYSDFGVRALTGYFTGPEGININDPTKNIILTSAADLPAFTLSNPGTTTDGSLLLTDIDAVDLGGSASRTLKLATGGLLKTTATNTVVSGLGRLSAGNTTAATLSVTVQSTGSLTLDSVVVNNAGADGVYGNTDDGAVRLAKGGNGELVLNAANTHTGGAQIDAGVVTLGHDSAFGSGSVTLGSATLRSGGGNRTLANNLVLAGTAVFSGPDAFTLSGSANLTGNRTLVTDVAVVLSGPVGQSAAGLGLTKSGAASLTLSGSAANTYSGATVVSAGELRLGKTSGVAVPGALTVGNGASASVVRLLGSDQIADSSAVAVGGNGTLALDGFSDAVGSLTVAGGASVTTGAGVLTLGGGLSHSGLGSASATISGNLNLGGSVRAFSIGDSAAADDLVVSAVVTNGGLAKSGAGTLRLDSANTYSGATTISAGTLKANAAQALPAASAVTVDSGGALDLNGFNHSLASLAGAGSVQLGSAALSVAGGNATYSGVMSGSGSLAKTGASSESLTLSGANTYSGATTVSSGTLVVASGSALGSTAAGTTVDSGATLALSGDSAVGAEALTLSGAGVGGAGALRNLSGANSYAGAVTLAADTTIASDSGSLALSGAFSGGTRAIVFNGAGDTAVSGALSGSGQIVKNGPGTLTFSGDNTYSGATIVNGGMLVAASDTALGASSAGVTVNNGGVLAFTGDVAIAAEPVTLNSGGALRNLAGDNTLAGPVSLGGAATLSADAGSLSLTGTLAAGGHAITVGGAGDITLASTLSGATSLAKTGSGILAFSADQTFSGELTLGGGVLSLQNVDVSVATLRVTAASVLDFAGASNLTVGTLILELPGGDSLSITSWQDVTDHFYVSNFLGAAYDIRNQSPMNRIVFADFSAGDTRWKSNNNEITPVPEPSAFGVLSLAGLAVWSRLRRRRRVAA